MIKVFVSFLSAGIECVELINIPVVLQGGVDVGRLLFQELKETQPKVERRWMYKLILQVLFERSLKMRDVLVGSYEGPIYPELCEQ